MQSNHQRIPARSRKALQRSILQQQEVLLHPVLHLQQTLGNQAVQTLLDEQLDPGTLSKSSGLPVHQRTKTNPVVFRRSQPAAGSAKSPGLIQRQEAEHSFFDQSTVVTETVLNFLVKKPSEWPLWAKLLYFIPSPLWIAPGAAAGFAIDKLLHFISLAYNVSEEFCTILWHAAIKPVYTYISENAVEMGTLMGQAMEEVGATVGETVDIAETEVTESLMDWVNSMIVF